MSSSATIARQIAQGPLEHRPPYRDPFPYEPAAPVRLRADKLRLAKTDTEFFQTDEPLMPFLERTVGAIRDATPELGALPLYIIVPEPEAMRSLAGLTFDGLYATYSAVLSRAGNDMGAGPGILVNAKRVYCDNFQAASQAGYGTGPADYFARLKLVGVAAHEFAHALRDGDRGDGAPFCDPDPEIARTLLEGCLNKDPKDLDQTPDRQAPFAKHDGQFLRAALHLAGRLRKRIPGLLNADVVDMDRYGLSSADDYAIALAGELKNQAPISNLLASAPPADFRNLWRNDVGRWWTGIVGAPAAAQEAAAIAGLALYK